MRAAVALAIVSTLALLAPAAPAGAVRAWQPPQVVPGEPIPQVNGGDPRGVAIDAYGDALYAVKQSTKYGYVSRTHAGSPSAAQFFPGENTLGNSPALFAMDGAGNTLDWGGFWSTYRPAGGVFGTAALHSPWTLIDVAMAPTGEALGLFANSSLGIKVAFRAAGAGSTFDLEHGTLLPPAVGDNELEGVGIAIDPDGAAVAVYSSKHSGSARTYLQSVRPAGGSFQNPTEIVGWPSAAGAKIDHAEDGTSILSTMSGPSVIAAVRPPGGSFGAVQTLATALGNNYFNTAPYVAAANGGGVVAWHETAPNNACPFGSGSAQGWRGEAYYESAWHPIGPGPGGFTSLSSVQSIDGAGSTVALLVENTLAHDAGDGCTLAGISHDLTAYVGTPKSLGGGATLVSSTEGQPGAAFIGAAPNGDALAGWSWGSEVSRLAAYEDPSTPGSPTSPPTTPGGGGSTTPGGSTVSTTPGSTSLTSGTTPGKVTAPAKVVLKGPLVLKGSVVPIEFHCNSVVECGMVVTLYGITKPSATKASATKASLLGRGTATIKPGRSGIVKVKLTRVARARLAHAKRHRLLARVQASVTSAGKTTTLTVIATLKKQGL